MKKVLGLLLVGMVFAACSLKSSDENKSIAPEKGTYVSTDVKRGTQESITVGDRVITYTSDKGVVKTYTYEKVKQNNVDMHFKFYYEYFANGKDIPSAPLIKSYVLKDLHPYPRGAAAFYRVTYEYYGEQKTEIVVINFASGDFKSLSFKDPNYMQANRLMETKTYLGMAGFGPGTEPMMPLFPQEIVLYFDGKPDTGLKLDAYDKGTQDLGAGKVWIKH